MFLPKNRLKTSFGRSRIFCKLARSIYYYQKLLIKNPIKDDIYHNIDTYLATGIQSRVADPDPDLVILCHPDSYPYPISNP